MASIHTDDVDEIRRRVDYGWTGAGVGGFVHPRRLHGLLLFVVGFKDWNARRALPPA